MNMSKCTLSKYRFITIIIFTLIAASIHAQVDNDELQNLPPVIFINYEGPHAKIDTREEIRQIGVVLGQAISEREKGIQPILDGLSIERRRSYTYRFEVGANNRYFVIHSISGPEDDKLDADIFGLGVDAGVDHIVNLRRIIQGYLQDAYDYSEKDASLLAEYITIYNAVYRGSWDYFTERYKTPVINHLTSDKAGLSIRYDEWPGRTLILIPLGHGGLSSIDTSAITDRRIIEELRREGDQGVTQRQEMVDLKEREAEQAEQKAQVQRETVREQERQVTEEKQQVQQERQQVDQEKQRIDQEREQIEKERQQIEDDLKAGRITEEEANKALQELDKREQDLQQQSKELEQKEQVLDARDDTIAELEEDLRQQRDEAQRYEDFAEQKIDEAQSERQDIASDQQAVIIQETTGGILGITIEKLNPSRGRLIRFNPITGTELKRSPLDTVHSRTVTFINGRIFAIAGENVAPGAVRLIELTQDNLTMAKQGEDDIKPGSLLWVNGNDLYAITNDLSNNNCYLGRFDTNLVLQAKSAVKVHPDASVTIQQGRLLTQREDGSALIFSPSDLKEVQ